MLGDVEHSVVEVEDKDEVVFNQGAGEDSQVEDDRIFYLCF